MNLEDDINVVGEYGSAQEAYGALIEKDVDVLVVDISMPDETGLSLFERLHKVKPNLKAIVLVSVLVSFYAYQCVENQRH